MQYQIKSTIPTKPKMRKIIFDDLSCGDIFQRCHQLYMRISTIYAECDCIGYNAIDLNDGEGCHFEEDEEVELYDDIVILNDKSFKSEREVK